MSKNTSTSERPMILSKKLSSEIEHKVKRQKQVGHTNAAVVKYEMLKEWIEQARYLEQLANDPEEAGREKSDLMRVVSDNRRWKSVDEATPPVDEEKLFLLENGGMVVGYMDIYGDYNPSPNINSGYDMSETFIESKVVQWTELPKPPE